MLRTGGEGKSRVPWRMLGGMFPVPPVVRAWLPPIVLALGALQAVSIGLQILLSMPELALLSLPFFGSAGVLGCGAWGLYQQSFWARGFAIGALLSSAIGGAWFVGVGAVLPASLFAMLILLSNDAPGRFEQRASFREQSGLSRQGARRLFQVGLGLGLGLPALLGSPLALVLFGAAPIPAALAACLGLLGLFGLTRLASFYFFAVCGALVAFVAAVVMTILSGRGVEPGGAALGVTGLLLALAPIVGPVWRALTPGPAAHPARRTR